LEAIAYSQAPTDSPTEALGLCLPGHLAGLPRRHVATATSLATRCSSPFFSRLPSRRCIGQGGRKGIRR
jgi:hypothetical protein